MIDLSGFVSRWSGVRCCTAPDCSSGPFCECVALVNQWCCENGWPTPQGATAATLTFPAGWVNVVTDDFLWSGQAGDVLIFDASLPGSNGAGHTCIYVYYGPAGPITFDQNWGSSDPPPQLIDRGAADFAYVKAVWRYEADMPHQEEDMTPEQAQQLAGIAAVVNVTRNLIVNGSDPTPGVGGTSELHKFLSNVQAGMSLANALRALAHAIDGR